MRLAEVIAVSVEDFDWIYSHVTSHRPDYRNIHLRERCQRAKKWDLRYLHAVRVKPREVPAIQGMISGPGVLWEYELVRTRTRTQVNVSIDEADVAGRERLGRQFLKELRKRVAQEMAGNKYFPRRTPGQLYMRRHRDGMPLSHPTCRRAVAAGVLDERFLAKVLPWGFQILYP